MSLETFGAILSFAASMEEEDGKFINAALANPRCEGLKELLLDLAKDAKKNHAEVLRARRENVTEMILEPIKGFAKAPYESQRGDAAAMEQDRVLAGLREQTQKAVAFYEQAAEKLRTPLPEVSRILGLVGKKRKRQLANLGG